MAWSSSARRESFFEHERTRWDWGRLGGGSLHDLSDSERCVALQLAGP